MQIFFVGVSNAMAQGERLHLSYERMALLVGDAPAFVDVGSREPKILKRIQTISYSFDFGAQQLKELGSLEYIKDRTPSGSRIPVISQPTVNLQFEYLFLDTKNEENIGFGIGEDSIFKNSPLYNKPDYNTHAEVLGDIDFILVADNESRRSDVFGGQVYLLLLLRFSGHNCCSSPPMKLDWKCKHIEEKGNMYQGQQTRGRT